MQNWGGQGEHQDWVFGTPRNAHSLLRVAVGWQTTPYNTPLKRKLDYQVVGGGVLPEKVIYLDRHF